MAVFPSRPKRWAEACGKASEAAGALREALEELQGLQGEYQDWKDNLPENLESSTIAEKLEAVTDLGIEDALGNLDEADNLISECEGADLPLGFGRD